MAFEMDMKQCKGLIDTNKRLLSSGDFADFTITTSEDTFRVHKAIVCSRSLVIKAAYEDPHSMRGVTGLIDVRLEDDHQDVAFMLDYLYSLDYPRRAPMSGDDVQSQPTIANSSPRRGRGSFIHPPGRGRAWLAQNISRESLGFHGIQSPPDLVNHVKMCAVGGKYDILGLQILARDKFQNEAQVHYNSQEFVQALKCIGTSKVGQDFEIRKTVVDIFAGHPELLDKEELRAAVKDLDLGFDLMMRYGKTLQSSQHNLGQHFTMASATQPGTTTTPKS